MSKLNLLVHLNNYEDSSSSNNPSLNNFKWTREITGISSDNAKSEVLSLAPGETKTLFSGTRTLIKDGTAQYDISLKPLTTNTYILKAVAGTLPNFRTPRSISSDATTEVSVTSNGPLMILTSTAGTSFDFTAVQVGDYIRIGDLFNSLNQGEFKVLDKTATSITVENRDVVVEGPIALGAGFADQIQVYSADGVQAGDMLVISGGFSLVTQGSYEISSVTANSVEFYSSNALPEETAILTDSIDFYFSAKNLIYIESDKKITATVNGSQAMNIEQFVINGAVKPGMLMLKSTVYSLTVENISTDTANLFLASAE